MAVCAPVGPIQSPGPGDGEVQVQVLERSTRSSRIQYRTYDIKQYRWYDVVYDGVGHTYDVVGHDLRHRR